MPGHILTGTPGAGKTAILRLLEANGHDVVEEAATDVIALEQALGHDEPWKEGTFLDEVTALQQRRQRAAGDTAFFDRSPLCTLALSHYLGFAPPTRLLEEIDRIATERPYAATVFLIRNRGFVEPTRARRINFEESLAFEQIHEEVYRTHGFHLVDVPAAPLPDRTALIERTVKDLHR